MPVSTRSAAQPPSRALRDSWPLTQLRLQPSVDGDDSEIEDLDLSKMDEDPLTFFLTPAPSPYGEGDDGMDFEMDFDAGIEDAKHPPPIVRSVSPSSLDGLSRPPPRSPTPPRPSSTPDLDHDLSPTPEDFDDDVQAAAKARIHSFRFPLLLKGLAVGKPRVQAKRGNGYTDSSSSLASPSSPRGSGQRQSAARPSPRIGHGTGSRRGRSRAVSSSYLSPRSWREPSPDVWSIEEETEENINRNMGSTTKAVASSVPPAKVQKRVRFVLPVEDEESDMHY
ncbi:hypothetical protein B0T26DRAFT_738136 [Lasiosphaeria miniovina]|uniref:Uncharacterized protein n=1 Tax=Lasiosphaeria miniovina TaxID=1954250 RepID=A0AA40E9K6_9PEZI|nr:uncharacterized protein B0T26DRAFT_738136 [Lasiosphaeria miniovina]KAK0727413.1 hypothetical protein B0T26DRAFT_738136 [Lasiosphaeria miniovina]